MNSLYYTQGLFVLIFSFVIADLFVLLYTSDIFQQINRKKKDLRTHPYLKSDPSMNITDIHHLIINMTRQNFENMQTIISSPLKNCSERNTPNANEFDMRSKITTMYRLMKKLNKKKKRDYCASFEIILHPMKSHGICFYNTDVLEFSIENFISQKSQTHQKDYFFYKLEKQQHENNSTHNLQFCSTKENIFETMRSILLQEFTFCKRMHHIKKSVKPINVPMKNKHSARNETTNNFVFLKQYTFDSLVFLIYNTYTIQITHALKEFVLQWFMKIKHFIENLICLFKNTAIHTLRKIEFYDRIVKTVIYLISKLFAPFYVINVLLSVWNISNNSF